MNGSLGKKRADQESQEDEQLDSQLNGEDESLNNQEVVKGKEAPEDDDDPVTPSKTMEGVFSKEVPSQPDAKENEIGWSASKQTQELAQLRATPLKVATEVQINEKDLQRQMKEAESLIEESKNIGEDSQSSNENTGRSNKNPNGKSQQKQGTKGAKQAQDKESEEGDSQEDQSGEQSQEEESDDGEDNQNGEQDSDDSDLSDSERARRQRAKERVRSQMPTKRKKKFEVNYTVGRIEDNQAVLLSNEHNILNVPLMLLPKNLKPGNILKFRVARNLQMERQREAEILSIQQQILEDPNFFNM